MVLLQHITFTAKKVTYQQNRYGKMNPDHAYREFVEKTDRAQTEFVSGNPDQDSIYKKLLGFQIEIQNLLDIPNPNTSIPNAYAKTRLQYAIGELCRTNIVYIFDALRPLEHNHIPVFSAIIRSVYESIPKMFYLFHNPAQILYVTCYEAYQNWIAFENGQQPYLNNFVKFVKTNEDYKPYKHIIDDFSKQCKSGKKIFAYSWYRDQVYESERLQVNKKIYTLLNEFSHNNWASYDVLFTNYTVPTMQFLNTLSFYNLFFFINAFAEILLENDLLILEKFFKKTYYKLNSSEVKDLYPNKFTYNNLRIDLEEYE